MNINIPIQFNMFFVILDITKNVVMRIQATIIPTFLGDFYFFHNFMTQILIIKSIHKFIVLRRQFRLKI